ncbi:hypothetical protein E2R68_09140 [Psychromonas sp. RZ22]|uniref:hypothetical protein n=1 Tax=Psychromonas algarum TaxID=2555643 RepID=UPI0010686463|nr:hypothetical protein [Psychromonas sp. RZ22]TEW54427.1 hypothetical protein E2R68_09140 [Psychromonas sp. RZ22]
MDRIILVAQQLAKEGKVPNTALIKARLPKNTPLPAIIQGLKMWQDDPNKQIDTPTEPSLTGATSQQINGSIDEIINSKIAQAIAPLKEEINSLKIQLKTLQENSTVLDK